ncbi:hypothetical protein PM082_000393 [Marasmius tenuissimus]|nr:hypothetical protein PM082_000393 [Marasmius tenuissimus]
MLSPLNIVTTHDGKNVDLTTWKPVEGDWEPDEIVRVYEWLHGMDYRSFTFPEIEVSSDFRRLVQKPGPIFTISPTKDVVEKALNLCKFNKNVKKPEERQRHEVFGSGPWEYILIPYEEVKKEDLPQLYQLSGGTTVPINYDPDDFDTLPRFTSSLHPLVGLYYLMRMMLNIYCYSEGIRHGVLTLFQEYEESVPFFLDCPFAPRPPSPKRSHSQSSSDEDEETCECSHCSRPALDSECLSAEEWRKRRSRTINQMYLKTSPSGLCMSYPLLKTPWIAMIHAKTMERSRVDSMRFSAVSRRRTANGYNWRDRF